MTVNVPSAVTVCGEFVPLIASRAGAPTTRVVIEADEPRIASEFAATSNRHVPATVVDRTVNSTRPYDAWPVSPPSMRHTPLEIAARVRRIDVALSESARYPAASRRSTRRTDVDVPSAAIGSEMNAADALTARPGTTVLKITLQPWGPDAVAVTCASPPRVVAVTVTDAAPAVGGRGPSAKVSSVGVMLWTVMFGLAPGA